MDLNEKLYNIEKEQEILEKYKYRNYKDYTYNFFNDIRDNLYNTYLSDTSLNEVTYIAGATYFYNGNMLDELCNLSKIKYEKVISNNIYGTYIFKTKVPIKNKVKSLFRK